MDWGSRSPGSEDGRWPGRLFEGSSGWRLLYRAPRVHAFPRWLCLTLSLTPDALCWDEVGVLPLTPGTAVVAEDDAAEVHEEHAGILQAG